MSVQEKLERACWHDELLQNPKNDSKIPTKRENKFRQTFEKMEGFSFVTPVTGLNRPNTGNEDDDKYWNINTFPIYRYVFSYQCPNSSNNRYTYPVIFIK
jgi:hypothetical protein